MKSFIFKTLADIILWLFSYSDYLKACISWLFVIQSKFIENTIMNQKQICSFRTSIFIYENYLNNGIKKLIH